MRIRRLRENGMWLISIIGLQVMMIVLWLCGVVEHPLVIMLPVLSIIAGIVMLAIAAMIEAVIGIIWAGIRGRIKNSIYN